MHPRQSFGGVVALAARRAIPVCPSKLIVVSSSLAKFRPDPRVSRCSSGSAGRGARRGRERHFSELSDESAQEFLRVALPDYNPTPQDRT
jgi:hypothetical protein